MQQNPADWRAINALRVLAMDAVEAANSGHPGTPMALAPAAYALYTGVLRHSPSHPDWADRDRFVLSCGHASMLLYGILHLTGYDVPLEQVRQFRQWGSTTPGHPERGHTPGVETTTGPLGQGIGNAAGMALAERLLAERFNRPGHRIVDHRTWAFVSDGDLMEGVASEAASLAGHLRLGKLTLVYDANDITIDGRASLSFSEDVQRRFEAYGWRVLKVDHGNDLEGIGVALANAAGQSERPTLIILKTVIADPAPTKRDTSEAHGAPLGREEVARTKALIGWPDEPFHVPADVYAHYAPVKAAGAARHADWVARVAAYRAAFPAEAAEFEAWMRGELPAGWQDAIPAVPTAKPLATREASALVLQALAEKVPNLVGGSADLAGSTGTKLKGLATVQPYREPEDQEAAAPRPFGRLLHWGVREHGMASVMNGIAAHGGLRPFGSTFLVFADYLRPSLRLSALMGLPVLYIGTHDSIGVGEDGPTHQPIEQLPSLRAVPNLIVLRPADANEVVEAWKVILQLRHQPAALILSRQALPTIDRARYAAASGVAQGAYVLADAPNRKPAVLLMATGSEVSLCVGAYEKLAAEGIGARVISMPSWEIFGQQTQEYRDAVLPPGITARVSVEQASTFGWQRFTGLDGERIGMHTFGASAPLKELQKKFGFSVDAVVEAAKRQIK
ncbi:MAG: transketolase [Gemmatimonadales bacterium]|nr:transketolase [Gemmatimonadales bacterium]